MQPLITKLIAHIISSISLCPYQSIDHISPCMSPSLLSPPLPLSIPLYQSRPYLPRVVQCPPLCPLLSSPLSLSQSLSISLDNISPLDVPPPLSLSSSPLLSPLSV